MKVKYVFPVEDLRGKSGGVSGLVASDWRGIKTMRTFVTPRNPQSTDQVLVRSYLSQCSKAYPTCSDVQKDDWEQIARSVPQNIMGKEIILPANAYFTRVNFFRLLGGAAIDKNAPEHYTPNFVISSIADVSIDLTTNILTFAVNHTGSVAAGDQFVTYMTPMYTSGIATVQESAYRLINGAASANTSIRAVPTTGGSSSFAALRTTVNATGYFGVKIYPVNSDYALGTPYYWFGQAAEA